MSNRARAAKRKTKLITKAIMFKPVFHTKHIYYTCGKTDCYFCRVMANQFEQTTSIRRNKLFLLASGK